MELLSLCRRVLKTLNTEMLLLMRSSSNVMKTMMGLLVCKSTCTANACYASDEFVQKYVETRQKLQERRTECMHKIVDHAR